MEDVMESDELGAAPSEGPGIRPPASTARSRGSGGARRPGILGLLLATFLAVGLTIGLAAYTAAGSVPVDGPSVVPAFTLANP
jgi:hypothetical protein